jgi:pimeloyl-ACP methyl ester carboxylesterase
LLAVVIGLSTSLSGQTEPLRPLHSGEKVYLLRGFTNVLSPGIDKLAEELRSRNVSMTVANHAFAATLASEALQDCQSGRISSIVLVGHSFGASAALSMAETLREAGLQVALIVTFDPVTRNSVPANVHRLENFHLSNWPRIFHAVGLEGRRLASINIPLPTNSRSARHWRVGRFHSSPIFVFRRAAGPAFNPPVPVFPPKFRTW